MSTMKLREIAARIDAHLKSFEADPKINARHRMYGTTPYWGAHCWWVPGSSRVSVLYVSYQGRSTMTKAEATAYLAWLDAGNNGYHYEALR